MTNMYFQVCSFFYMMMIIIIFYSKRRIKNRETKIFSLLSTVNIFGIIIDIIIVYLSYVVPGCPPLYILNKFYLLYIALWTFLFFRYIFDIVLKGKYKIVLTVGKTILIITSLLTFILPIYLYNTNNVMYTYGPSVTSLYISEAIYVIIIFIIIIFNLKTIVIKKIIPLVVLLFCCIVALVVRIIDPGILLTTTIITYINILMYHTIENPDMKLIAQLNEARDQAEKANNAKSEFLSNMSHEIRTPLNAIVGFSQALLEEDINDNAKEEVKDIVSASSSLLEIVNGILDISKIESGKLEIVNTEYNLNNILNDLVALTKARMGEKPLEFRTNFDPTIPSILYGDHVRVKQIILNLLTNAVKYTKEGYIEFKVSTVRKDDIIRLIISVEDSGIGIKEDKIDKLFSKFERLDIEKNNTIEGTGLGLAITKRLIELMNGKIVVQSVYGKGSRFTVAIDQKIISDAPLKEEKITMSDEIIDCSSKKVLIVDDNKLNLKVASRLLEKYKCDIETIDNGLEAIELIKKNKYDLILLDDMMPKLSGTETLLKLKEIDSFDIPVVALTANAITGMKEKYLKVGFNDYLSKPIDKTELNRIINEFLK